MSWITTKLKFSLQTGTSASLPSGQTHLGLQPSIPFGTCRSPIRRAFASSTIQLSLSTLLGCTMISRGEKLKATRTSSSGSQKTRFRKRGLSDVDSYSTGACLQANRMSVSSPVAQSLTNSSTNTSRATSTLNVTLKPATIIHEEFFLKTNSSPTQSSFFLRTWQIIC